MRLGGHTRFAALMLVLIGASASAETLTIDLPTAVSLARQRAPEAVAALGRIGEVGALGSGASVPFTQRPELQIGAGPRFGNGRTLNLQAQLSQQLELGRRGARVAVADAELAHARALGDAELRTLGLEVSMIYCEARHADLVVELATRTQEVATRAAEVAERRRTAGELTDLDVHLATIALGRARSALAAAPSERAGAIGNRGAMIGAKPDDTIVLAGALVPPAIALAPTSVTGRADVRALDAEAAVANAEDGRARANGRPDLGIWFGYQLDEGDAIALAGVSFTLPLWNPARGDRAVARAKQKRIDSERTATVTAASRQVVDAQHAYVNAREAVEVFEREVLTRLADSEMLLSRSLESGQLAISDYLVARQQILEGRREYLDRQLALAKAGSSAATSKPYALATDCRSRGAGTPRAASSRTVLPPSRLARRAPEGPTRSGTCTTGGSFPPSSCARATCRGTLGRRSAPRTISVIPMPRSSTTTAS